MSTKLINGNLASAMGANLMASRGGNAILGNGGASVLASCQSQFVLGGNVTTGTQDFCRGRLGGGLSSIVVPKPTSYATTLHHQLKAYQRSLKDPITQITVDMVYRKHFDYKDEAQTPEMLLFPETFEHVTLQDLGSRGHGDQMVTRIACAVIAYWANTQSDVAAESDLERKKERIVQTCRNVLRQCDARRRASPDKHHEDDHPFFHELKFPSLLMPGEDGRLQPISFQKFLVEAGLIDRQHRGNHPMILLSGVLQVFLKVVTGDFEVQSGMRCDFIESHRFNPSSVDGLHVAFPKIVRLEDAEPYPYADGKNPMGAQGLTKNQFESLRFPCSSVIVDRVYEQHAGDVQAGPDQATLLLLDPKMLVPRTMSRGIVRIVATLLRYYEQTQGEPFQEANLDHSFPRVIVPDTQGRLQTLTFSELATLYRASAQESGVGIRHLLSAAQSCLAFADRVSADRRWRLDITTLNDPASYPYANGCVDLQRLPDQPTHEVQKPKAQAAVVSPTAKAEVREIPTSGQATTSAPALETARVEPQPQPQPSEQAPVKPNATPTQKRGSPAVEQERAIRVRDEIVITELISTRTGLDRIIGQKSIKAFITGVEHGLPPDRARIQKGMPVTTQLHAALVHADDDAHASRRDVDVALAYAEVLHDSARYGSFESMDYRWAARMLGVGAPEALIGPSRSFLVEPDTGALYDFFSGTTQSQSRGRGATRSGTEKKRKERIRAMMERVQACDTGKIVILDAKKASPNTIFASILYSTRPVILIQNAAALRNALDPNNIDPVDHPDPLPEEDEPGFDDEFDSNDDDETNGMRSKRSAEKLRQVEIAAFLRFLKKSHASSAILLSDTQANLDALGKEHPELRALTGHRLAYEPYGGEELARAVRRKAEEDKFFMTEGAEQALQRQLRDQKGFEPVAEAAYAEVVAKWRETVFQLQQQGQQPTRDDLDVLDSRFFADQRFDKVEQQGPTELDGLVGMEGVKKQLRSIVALIQLSRRREAAGVVEPKPNLHMEFVGNPGTGKTTAARAFGAALQAIGYLKKGHVIEVRPADLLGTAVGQAEKAVTDKVSEALDGILFIDEAHQLASANSPYGTRALQTLIPLIENYRERLVVILAGYEEEMQELYNLDPGLRRRIPKTIQFADYSDDELATIVEKIAEKANFYLGDGAIGAAREILSSKRSGKNFGNAGEARNLIDAAILRQSDRLHALEAQGTTISSDDLRTLTSDDFYGEERPKPFDAAKAIEGLIGLHAVKQEIKRLISMIRMAQRRGADPRKTFEPYFSFSGPPGTGKTTVARIIGGVMKSLGLLPTDKVVETSGAELSAGYVGQSSGRMLDILKSALGGTLFIDEIDGLAAGGYSNDVKKVLLKFMEDNRGRMVIIVAGYDDSVNAFLQSDAGFSRRFNRRMQFESFTPTEAADLFSQLITREGYSLDPIAAGVLASEMHRLVAAPNWSSGGDVRTLVNEVIAEHALYLDEHEDADVDTITASAVDAAVNNVIAKKERERPRTNPPEDFFSGVRPQQGQQPSAGPESAPADREQRQDHRVERQETIDAQFEIVKSVEDFESLSEQDQRIFQGMEEAVNASGLDPKEILAQLEDSSSELMQDIAKRAQVDVKTAVNRLRVIRKIVKEPGYCPVCKSHYPDCAAAGVLWPWATRPSRVVEGVVDAKGKITWADGSKSQKMYPDAVRKQNCPSAT